MTSKQIEELKNYGIELGSHTLSHHDLSKISYSKMESEINISKYNLEQIFGITIVSFCYPAGKYNVSARDEVEKAGYKFAVTTKEGESVFSHPFDLERLRMNRTTDINLYLK